MYYYRVKQTVHACNCKGKGLFLYSSISSPLDRSKRFTLVALPDRPVHSDTDSAYLRSILAMQQLRNDYSHTCPPLSIVRYSFIQLSRLRRREENENAQISKRQQRGIRTRALDYESAILSLSYTMLYIVLEHHTLMCSV